MRNIVAVAIAVVVAVMPLVRAQAANGPAMKTLERAASGAPRAAFDNNLYQDQPPLSWDADPENPYWAKTKAVFLQSDDEPSTKVLGAAGMAGIAVLSVVAPVVGGALLAAAAAGQYVKGTSGAGSIIAGVTLLAGLAAMLIPGGGIVAAAMAGAIGLALIC